MSAARAAALLERLLADGACCIGEVRVARSADGFVMHHRDDGTRAGLTSYSTPEDALQLARYDAAGKFRALKTAPTLRRGWRLVLRDIGAVQRAVDYFYPGRLAALLALRDQQLTTTTLRDTLARQSGMYRVAASATDAQIDEVVGTFCRSDGGCLRTILWKRDRAGSAPSSLLPPEKFDPAHDQTGEGENAIPLLCQEACNLLVGAIREAVKAAR